MLTAAEKAVAWCDNQTLADLRADDRLALAVVKLIEIIGEAANHVDEIDQASLPLVPWRDIIAMRHNLVHIYFGIDYKIVWETVRRDLPALIETLRKYLEKETEPP